MGECYVVCQAFSDVRIGELEHMICINIPTFFLRHWKKVIKTGTGFEGIFISLLLVMQISSSTTAASKCLPKGIHVIGTEKLSGPSVEGMSQCKRAERRKDPSTDPTSWSYLFILHMTVRRVESWLKAYNAKEENKDKQQHYFIHKTLRYSYKDKERQQGVKKTWEQSISGLVFLQGTVKGLQAFLKENFPQYHLVNDRCLGRPVSIGDSIMQPFMNVMKTRPEQVTFLRDAFEKFAKDHVKLRVLTGPFKDYEGYIVRIDRDRQLVFDFGGMAVAIRGVHKEDFEVVEE